MHKDKRIVFFDDGEMWVLFRGAFVGYPTDSQFEQLQSGMRPKDLSIAQDSLLSLTAPEVRSAVAVFANAMEQVLRENDHKGGWDDMGVDALISRMREELVELEDSWQDADTPIKNVLREAVDVANYAMKIHDNLTRPIEEQKQRLIEAARLEQPSPSVVQAALDQIREVLWPGGDPEREWNSETIEHVARALYAHDLGPKKKEPGK